MIKITIERGLMAENSQGEALKVGDSVLIRAEFLGQRWNEVKVAIKSLGSVTNYEGEAQISIPMEVLAARAADAPWKCKAQRTADPPQDCDWPVCGCDPYADKVIAALQESGKLADAPLREAAERRQIECQAILDLMGKEPYLAKGHVENGEYKWTVVADKISVTELFAAPAEGKPHK